MKGLIEAQAVIKSKAATGKAVASLANPTKKARKFQAMEFESDED
jgi:hypothetical protein